MDYTIVDEDFAQPAPGRARALVTPKLHAVTPEAGLREWDGVPSFGVVAFIGYLIALAVLFSNQLVPTASRISRSRRTARRSSTRSCRSRWPPSCWGPR